VPVNNALCVVFVRISRFCF